VIRHATHDWEEKPLRFSHAVGAGRALVLTTATAASVVLGALPASAAPPSHDTITGAKAITVPFSETVDTTEATTDAEDAAINTNCGAPATNGSVWYTVTPSSSAFAYIVDVSRSDFTAGVIVATGTPGNLSLVTCGPQAIAFQPAAGETYYIMAFSDNPDVVGGQLSIEVTESAPPPTVSMVVNEVGRVNTRTGEATLSGTYTCEGEAEFVILQGTLSQRQGDVHVTGDFLQEDLKCGGTFDWTAQVVPQNGKFTKGLAATIAVTIGCNRIGCNFYETLDVVRLRGGGRD
jgi:hypothetical protein